MKNVDESPLFATILESSFFPPGNEISQPLATRSQIRSTPLIAVLDSGLHSAIRSSRVRPQIDIDGITHDARHDSADSDLLGHGTLVASCLLKRSAICELAPIRVFDDLADTSCERVTAGVRAAMAIGAPRVDLAALMVDHRVGPRPRAIGA